MTSPELALSFLLPTAIGLYAAFNGVQSILAPDLIESINPAGKVANVARLTVINAATGVAGLVVIGAVSDATTGRFGRRAPWLASMAALSLAFAAMLSQSRTVTVIALNYGAVGFTLNGFQAALLAVAPDRVPERLRSRASSVFAVAGPIGGLIGINLAAHLPATIGYLALAWLFRVLMFAAQFAINNYLLYILRDYVGEAALPGHDARSAAGLIGALRTAMTLIAIFAGHHLAARTTRRGTFAQGYAVLTALAMLAPALSPTWAAMLAFAGFGGLAMGLYAVIDLALMSRVLPDPRTARRDLALLVMAGAMAQFIAPTMASFLIDRFGYPALFLASATITVAAGGVVGRLRGVD